MKRLRVDETDEKGSRFVKSPVDSCFGEPGPEPGPSSQLREINVENVAITTIKDDVQCEPTDSTDRDPVAVQAKAQEALGNHLILKEIFKSLTVSSLLQFSLVNNFWNSCARTVLRENKKCVAFIHREEMCSELKELDMLIGKSLNVPFNGLSILPGDSSACPLDHDGFHDKNLHTFYANLVDKLNCKYVDIRIWTKNKNDRKKSKECLGLIILKHILRKSASQLERLSITDLINYIHDEDNYDTPLYTFLGFTEANFRFPKLTHLQISEKSAGMDWTALASTLLEATPNVREITGGISVVQLKLFIEQKKVNVLKELHFHPIYEDGEFFIMDISEPGLQLFLDCIQLGPKLAKLSISTMSYENELIKNYEKWFPMVAQIYTGLLSSSSNTLQELHIYHLDLILLSRLQIPPLTRVTHITVNYYFPKLAWSFTLIDYPAVFPNVQSVTLICDMVYDHQSRYFFEGVSIEEQEDGFYVSNSKEIYENQALKTQNYNSCHSWSSITKLKFECCRHIGHIAFVNSRGFDPILSKIFPNVTEVTITSYDGIGSACDILWTAWPKVESIAFLNMKDTYIHECLDKHFTGMSQESCDIIQDLILNGQDFSELIEKHQTKPSIRNLTELKRFRVEFSHDDCDDNRFKSNSYNEIFLTEVTKKCALDFMPSLSFEIKGNTCDGSNKLCYFSLDHLKPNVKLFISPDL